MIQELEPFKSWTLEDEKADVRKKFQQYPKDPLQARKFCEIVTKGVKLNFRDEKLSY